MKAPTASQMRRIDADAVEKYNMAGIVLMENAGRAVADAIVDYLREPVGKRVCVFCGKGNNGGDAWAAGIHLLQQGISVHAFALYTPAKSSPLNRKFREKFVKSGGIINKQLDFNKTDLILDGFLGTGFQGKVEPSMALAIEQANASGKPILAIDIPSGLDGTTGEMRGSCIMAQETVTLGLAKTGFFLRDGWNRVGRLRVEDFGLPKKFLRKAHVFGMIPDAESLRALMPPIVRVRHKYQTGYVVGFSGSKVLQGAPKLAGLAALRSGAGIVRIFHLGDIGETPIDLICQKWEAKSWKKELLRARSVFLGPGIGKSKQMRTFLKKRFKEITQPVVVDADAIQGDIVYPKNAILTPHRGEVLRLLGIQEDRREEDLLARCQKWAHRHECILILKGAPTFIFSSAKPPVIIPRGDPGMAKAGTGDVLTGILAALLAQKVKPLDAAILGVFLHAVAGEKAAAAKTSSGMIASDLLDHLSDDALQGGHGMIHLKPVDEV